MSLVPSKALDAGGGLSIVFDERGPGEESPLWRGRIFWRGDHVGEFHNDGRGGQTFIRPQSAVEAFRAAVDASAPEVHPERLFEREALVLIFAEAKLYDPAAARLTLGDVVREHAAALTSVPWSPPSAPIYAAADMAKALERELARPGGPRREELARLVVEADRAIAAHPYSSRATARKAADAHGVNNAVRRERARSASSKRATPTPAPNAARSTDPKAERLRRLLKGLRG